VAVAVAIAGLVAVFETFALNGAARPLEAFSIPALAATRR
jgi:hypothetical protein